MCAGVDAGAAKGSSSLSTKQKTINKAEKPCRKAAINQKCRICLDKAHGFHFSVMVCRACAAFFRRTVALNLQYHCRFENNCDVTASGEYPSIRSLCRACRYVRCVNLGMNAESVQLNRESTPVSSTTASSTPPMPPSFPSSSMSSISPSISSPGSCILPTSTPSFDQVEHDLFSRINAIFDNALHYPRTSSDLPIIDQFRIGLNQLRMDRQVKHTVQLTDLEQFHGTDQFKAAWKGNWEKINDMSVVEIDLIAEMVSYVRPFVLLPVFQRWILFKKFFVSFARIERAYETFRVLGDDVNDMRSLVYNGQCISIMHALMEEAKYLEVDYELKTVLSLFRPTRVLMIKGILNPLKKLKPTEVEFAVMSLHLLFLHPGLESVTDETENVSSLCRQQAFNELHYYYTHQLGLSNYAVRLGEFMSLMSTVEKYVNQKKENMIVTELFSIVKVSPAILSVAR